MLDADLVHVALNSARQEVAHVHGQRGLLAFLEVVHATQELADV